VGVTAVSRHYHQHLQVPPPPFTPKIGLKKKNVEAPVLWPPDAKS